MSLAIPDIRAEAIINWLNNDLGFEIHDFKPASTDASFRRYFRVFHSAGRHIVMDAPPDKENTEPFIRIADLLKNSNIHVPEIYQQNVEQGFLLLEDFGCSNFLDQLTVDTADQLYQAAFNSLLNLQTQTNIQQYQLSCYDEALLRKELTIFYEWFLQNLLSIKIPERLQTQLNALLIDSALAQPQVCVHRDFHSRNLMVLKNRSPGVIDFQDAVIGPITYDLVSLLRDCYISWPQQQVEQWMQQYYQRLSTAGLINNDLRTFTHWFDLMGLQRHLKAIGIFARLHLRDNKPGYLADIPRTMGYVIQICQAYPELADYRYFLQTQILPFYQSKL